VSVSGTNQKVTYELSLNFLVRQYLGTKKMSVSGTNQKVTYELSLNFLVRQYLGTKKMIRVCGDLCVR